PGERIAERRDALLERRGASRLTGFLGFRGIELVTGSGDLLLTPDRLLGVVRLPFLELLAEALRRRFEQRLGFLAGSLRGGEIGTQAFDLPQQILAVGAKPLHFRRSVVRQ